MCFWVPPESTAAHKLTTRLASCYGIIGIEDLNLKGLLKNRRLSRAFSDAALGKLLHLLDTKVEQRGGQIITVGRFFPSSKTCHACGWKWEDMQLSDRIFICQNLKCAYHHFEQDRDYNASLNILREALHLIGLFGSSRQRYWLRRGRKLGCGRGVRPKGFCLQAPTDEAATTKGVAKRCLHTFSYNNWSSSISSLLRVRTRLAVSPTLISSKVRFSIISMITVLTIV